jgi:hypothetical protein
VELKNFTAFGLKTGQFLILTYLDFGGHC